MQNEIWKPIKGYEGLYEVSNQGRVRSLDRTRKCRNNHIAKVKGKEITPCRINSGYFTISLKRDSIADTRLIHRIVAETFIENPHSLPCVNHKDENKSNNCVDNLEWCDYYYNNHYGTAIYRRSRTRGKVVIQYSLDGKEIARYWSAREAARVIGKSQAPISKCCIGNRKYYTAYGYIWRYEKEG